MNRLIFVFKKIVEIALPTYVARGLLLVFLSLSINAFSANLPPGTVELIDPGRINEELKQQQESSPGLVPEPIIIKKKNIKENQSKSEITFILRKIIIQGNTVFSNKELYKIYKNKIGKNISTADVYQIAQDLTAYYRNAGYILTQVIVPPQTIDDKGIIKLQVIEGYINKIDIRGPSRLSNANEKLLKAYGQQIIKKRPLDIATLERFTLLANDIPGASVKAVIEPSSTDTGAAQLTLNSAQERVSAYINANNFNSELLGRTQLIAEVDANGFFAGSQTGVRGALSILHPQRLQYISIMHKQQLNNNGFGILANVSNTTTKPNYESISLNNLNTPGEAFTANVACTYPVLRSRVKNFFVGIGFNYLNSNTSFADVNLFNDSLRWININFIYNFLDEYIGSNILKLSFDQGLNILAAKALPPSIPGGKIDFSKINFSASRYQGIANSNLFCLIWLNTQYSFNQLLSSQKFGFGGAPFGYGYDPSALTGDSGYEVKLEGQYNYYFNKYRGQKIQLFVFGDNATTWNINKIQQIGHQNATSAGGGLRATMFKKLHVEFIVAKPFSKLFTSDNSNNVRYLFNLTLNSAQT